MMAEPADVSAARRYKQRGCRPMSPYLSTPTVAAKPVILLAQLAKLSCAYGESLLRRW